MDSLYNENRKLQVEIEHFSNQAALYNFYAA